MKKLKYLLWLFVVWLWLLINQSFWLDVELIDFWQSQYLVQFPYNMYCPWDCYDYMYYNISYNNWYNKINISPYYLPDECWDSDCTSYQFNNSITWFNYYDSSSYHYSAWSIHPFNISYSYWLDFVENNLNQIVLWSQNTFNQWQAFVCVDCFNTNISENPKFWLWSDFILTNAYKLVWSKDTSYVRLYNEFHTWFDVNSVDFNTMSWWWFPFDSWEYFTHSQTWTSYWRIANQWYVFSYIWSYRWIWYSYIYSLDLNNSWTINRSNLQFRTIYDQVVAPLKLMAANNQWILLDSDLSWFYYDWVLVLPIYSYNSWLNLWQYLIAKDPTNTQRVLYEMYSCNNNNVESVWSWLWTEFCAKLDAWYLTYDWSTSVLPFTSYTQEFSVNYSPDFYPLLTDLTQNLRLSTEDVSAWFKIWDHFYWFQSDPSVNIYDSLNSDDPLNNPILNQDLIRDKCINDPDYYSNNMSVCSEFMWWNNNVVYHTWWQYWYTLQTVCTYSWEDLICYDKLVPVNLTWNVYVDQYWDTYYISNNPELSSLSTTWSFVYVSWYIDSGWLLTWSYFSDYFSKWLFFSCPYPEVHTFWFIEKIKIWNYYPFAFVNCFVSAFRAWNTVHYFDDFWVFPSSYWYWILYWDTKYHHILFRFFDLLLSVWIFMFLSALIRLFKHH